jgi:tRNA(fMet)-specific endonuclease VapC
LTHLLDSNILIEHLAGRFDLTARIRTLGVGACALPTISVYEVLHGALRSGRQGEFERTRELLSSFPSVGFDGAAAETAAVLRYRLESKGNVIGPHDLMIAAIAVSSQLTLVTHNLREFSRISELNLEDWQEGG